MIKKILLLFTLIFLLPCVAKPENSPGTLITLVAEMNYIDSMGKPQNTGQSSYYLVIASPLQAEDPNTKYEDGYIPSKGKISKPVFMTYYDKLANGLTIKLYDRGKVITGILLNDQRMLVDNKIVTPDWPKRPVRSVLLPKISPILPTPISIPVVAPVTLYRSLDWYVYISKYSAGYQKLLRNLR